MKVDVAKVCSCRRKIKVEVVKVCNCRQNGGRRVENEGGRCQCVQLSSKQTVVEKQLLVAGLRTGSIGRT